MKLIKFFTWTCWVIMLLIIFFLNLIPIMTLEKIPYNIVFVNCWIMVLHGIITVFVAYYIGTKLEKNFKKLEK